MRKSLIAATAALALAAGAVAMPLAQAAPPPPGPMGGPPMGGPMGGPHPHPWMRGMWHHPPHPRLIAPGTFALFYHPKDRQLTAADVSAIATGFLRWNGNHSWKVIDVKPAGEAHIGFAYATADGSVIARFTINSHTGRIRRVG